MKYPELSNEGAKRLLKVIAEQIEIDEMIKNMELPTDEEVAEIEAAIANMPPLTQDELDGLAEVREAFLEMVREDKEERDRLNSLTDKRN